MKLLIKKATIIDSSSQHDGQQKDILIQDGRFVAIEDNLNLSDIETVSYANLHVSQGWVDLKAHFCDPGTEHKETIDSGLKAASFGGYTHVAILPSTQPTADNKTHIEYSLQRSSNKVTEVHPIGAITKGLEGKYMAELFDMYSAGVRIFSDDMQYVSPQMLLKTLLYIKNFGGTVSVFPHNKNIAQRGVVNEGIASIHTGLNADPQLSEIIEVERNIRLLEYTQSRLHLTGISCAESVELIHKAKKKGLSLTADVHIANLIYTEEENLKFDTNYKFLPVLRTENDRQTLWQALKDGTIDTVVSDHRPSDREDKLVEFDRASFGTIQLQTVFGNLAKCREFELIPIVKALSEKSRKILNIKQNPIDINNSADITLFIPAQKWFFKDTHILSRSRETAMIDQELQGWIVGIINKGQVHFNQVFF